MTKLYISYYGDSISIVEGSYKKNKFIIDDVILMNADDIEPNYNDKYNLLKEALASRQFKSKKAVLCLNTRDVIIKSNKIPKIGPKELDGIMSMEIDEMISLERDQYTFSYEVVREFEEDGEELLDLVLAALETTEVNNILNIFDDFSLKLEYIDILPTAYARVLKEVEYSDMMIVNTGNYSTSIDIYKEDSLYIHDNVPVRLNEDSQIYDYMRLVDEANGLMNYYSSRNYGKIVDTILLIGSNYNNNNVIDGFKKLFTSEIVSGIENLYDIENDIKGEIDGFNLNQIVEIIGCMLREQKKSIYFQMNLLPEDIKRKYYKSEKALKYLKAVPIVILILSVPIIVLGAMDIMKQKELDLAKSKLEEIKNEYGQISKIEEDIKSTEEEIKLYDMLIQKEPKWGAILSSIDKNIPYKVQLDNLSLSYVAENNTKNQNNEQVQNENNSQDNENSTTQNTEQNEKMYDKVPNFISITGQASTPSLVGQFVYNLKALTYFEDIKLSGVTEQSSGNDDSKKTSYSFSITAKVKDGVIISE